MTTDAMADTTGAESLGEREREAVLRLVRMVEHRAETERALDDRLEEQTESAGRVYKETIRKADAEAEAATAQTDHDRGTKLEQLTKHFDRQASDAANAHQQARGNAISELDSAQRLAEEGLRDAAWLAEASYEGGAEQPKQELERVRGLVRAEFGKLDSIEAHAMRLAGPRVKMPRTTPEESETDPGPGDVTTPPLDLLAGHREKAFAQLQKLRRPTLHGFLRIGGPIFLIFIAAAAVGLTHGLRTGLGEPALTGGLALGAGAIVLILTLPLRTLALRATRRKLEPLAVDLREARRLGRVAVRMAEQNKLEIEGAIAERRENEVKAGRTKYENRLARVKLRRDQILARLDRRHTMMAAEIRKRREVELASVEEHAELRRSEIERERSRVHDEAEKARSAAVRRAKSEYEEALEGLTWAWRETLEHAVACFGEVDAAMVTACPAWDGGEWSAWRPPLVAAPAVRIGSFSADLDRLPGGRPGNAEMMRGLPGAFSPATLLDFPTHASLLLRSEAAGRDGSLDVLRNTMLRMVTALPAGKVRLTMVDPVGLGQSFAGFMRLADHDERLVGSRIWTEARHIEQRLADLTEHMETVIQKYLRNEFPSIEAYNEQAGEIAEPYRFLVVADFPTGFTDEAARRLSSIIESGPRCGVFVLIHQDARGKLPETITQEEIDAGCNVIEHEPSESEDGNGEGRFVVRDPAFEHLPLTLERPPRDDEVARILDVVGATSLVSGKVEVPFGVLAPDDGESWSRSCDEELKIPLGRAGATKLQHMTLGRGTSQHVLLAGKTGSGKSTLLHVLITAASMWYSPDEIEFYLVDFKKGVEFKAYCGDRIPHVRAVAVESDREFGLSVLHRLDEELKRRGDLFRELGVQSIGAARKAIERHKRDAAMPRVLLVIDEFQEFFTEDDKLAQDAGLLLDRLVRQGRAFGMHVLLGSQTLSGAYSLARSTVGQMAVRIALQCSETDSYLILSEDNAAARLLNRPGEAIYNDSNGTIEGNSPFQVCWLPDAERDAMLARVRTIAGERPFHHAPPAIVFEGNVPADLSDNQDLLAAIAPDAQPTRAAKAWIGDPVEIKPPTGAFMRRQAGANLLIVGQQDDTSRAMLSSALVGLAAQHVPDSRKGPEGAKIAFLDSTPPDDAAAETVERIVERLAEPGSLDVSFGRVRQAAGVVGEFEAELRRREADDASAHAPWYLILLGLQRFRDLRKKEDDFSFSFSSTDDGDDDGDSPAGQLADLLRDGPPLGLHVIAWCDTGSSLTRTLDRATIGQFEQRAVFQMSAADSSNLIDSPAAGKLGMNRGLLFNEELGTLEKFRPYRMPSDDLVARVAAALRR
ncbi:MAG: AAA family ATPase [Phycisphaeraceae bacterium]|nr:MAG: AAA family ATPase [Phycisphaeraceae bacterium]